MESWEEKANLLLVSLTIVPILQLRGEKRVTYLVKVFIRGGTHQQFLKFESILHEHVINDSY